MKKKRLLVSSLAVLMAGLSLASCTGETVPDGGDNDTPAETVVYTVVFQNEDGSVIESKEFNQGDTIVAPTSPTKDGYNFLGWDSNGDGTVDGLGTATANATFKAVFAKELETFTATFKVGETETLVSFKEGDTTLQEPSIPAREGYTAAWEAYTLSNQDLTINAVYTAIEYTVTFKADGVDVGTATYTVENKDITVPAVPNKEGFTGSWEGYQLTTGDVVVEAIYIPAEYKITLMVDGVYYNEVHYTIEDETVALPDVPAKTGYTAAWETYTLSNQDLTINAVYTAIQYTVTFKADGVDVATATYTVENKNITVPYVPNKDGYTGVWESYTLEMGNVTVNAVYTENLVYENMLGSYKYGDGYILVDPGAVIYNGGVYELERVIMTPTGMILSGVVTVTLVYNSTDRTLSSFGTTYSYVTLSSAVYGKYLSADSELVIDEAGVTYTAGEIEYKNYIVGIDGTTITVVLSDSSYLLFELTENGDYVANIGEDRVEFAKCIPAAYLGTYYNYQSGNLYVTETNAVYYNGSTRYTDPIILSNGLRFETAFDPIDFIYSNGSFTNSSNTLALIPAGERTQTIPSDMNGTWVPASSNGTTLTLDGSSATLTMNGQTFTDFFVYENYSTGSTSTSTAIFFGEYAMVYDTFYNAFTMSGVNYYKAFNQTQINKTINSSFYGVYQFKETSGGTSEIIISESGVTYNYWFYGYTVLGSAYTFSDGTLIIFQNSDYLYNGEHTFVADGYGGLTRTAAGGTAVFSKFNVSLSSLEGTYSLDDKEILITSDSITYEGQTYTNVTTEGYTITLAEGLTLTYNSSNDTITAGNDVYQYDDPLDSLTSYYGTWIGTSTDGYVAYELVISATGVTYSENGENFDVLDYRYSGNVITLTVSIYGSEYYIPYTLGTDSIINEDEEYTLEKAPESLNLPSELLGTWNAKIDSNVTYTLEIKDTEITYTEIDTFSGYDEFAYDVVSVSYSNGTLTLYIDQRYDGVGVPVTYTLQNGYLVDSNGNSYEKAPYTIQESWIGVYTAPRWLANITIIITATDMLYTEGTSNTSSFTVTGDSTFTINGLNFEFVGEQLVWHQMDSDYNFTRQDQPAVITYNNPTSWNGTWTHESLGTVVFGSGSFEYADGMISNIATATSSWVQTNSNTFVYTFTMTIPMVREQSFTFQFIDNVLYLVGDTNEAFTKEETPVEYGIQDEWIGTYNNADYGSFVVTDSSIEYVDGIYSGIEGSVGSYEVVSANSFAYTFTYPDTTDETKTKSYTYTFTYSNGQFSMVYFEETFIFTKETVDPNVIPTAWIGTWTRTDQTTNAWTLVVTAEGFELNYNSTLYKNSTYEKTDTGFMVTCEYGALALKRTYVFVYNADTNAFDVTFGDFSYVFSKSA